MASVSDFLSLELPREVVAGWQSAVDVMTELMGAPVGLLTRMHDKELEVLVSSRTGDNPFKAGDRRTLLGSGLFCEEVVRTRGVLNVEDGRTHIRWREASSVKDGWLAHLGAPLLLPGGHVFGTLSVKHRMPHRFTRLHESLLFRIRDLVETQLALLFMHRDLKERTRLLAAYRDELKQLRDVFPICPMCKKIRNDAEYWDLVEDYFVTHAMGEFGHGLCPECAEHHWGETLLEPEPVPLPRGLGPAGTVKA